MSYNIIVVAFVKRGGLMETWKSLVLIYEPPSCPSFSFRNGAWSRIMGTFTVPSDQISMSLLESLTSS